MGVFKAIAKVLRKLRGWFRAALCSSCCGGRPRSSRRRRRTSTTTSCTSVTQAPREDLTLRLPDEMLLAVLEFLPPADRCRAAATCKRWYRLCDDSAAWRRWHKRLHLPANMSEEESRRECVSQMLWRKEKATVTLRSVQEDCGISQEAVLLDWNPEYVVVRAPNGYPEVWSTEGEGQIHRFDSPAYTGKRDDGVISARVFGDRAVVVTGSMEIKMWCMRTGALLSTMKGHNSPVIEMDMDEYLFTAGGNHRVGVWEPQSGLCLGLLDEHQPCAPMELQCRGRRGISADWCGRAMLWDLAEGRCVHRLETNKHGPETTRDSPLLVSVSTTHAAICERRGGRLRLLCAATGNLIYDTETHERRLFNVNLSENLVAVSGSSGTVWVWGLKPLDYLFKVSVFMAGSYRTVLHHSLLFVQSETLTQVYDMHTRRLVQTICMPPVARHRMVVRGNKVLTVAHRCGRNWRQLHYRREPLCFHQAQVRLSQWGDP